jgi:hypothetical protein
MSQLSNDRQIATAINESNIPDLNQHTLQDQQIAEIPTINLAPVEVEQTNEAPLTGVYSSSGFDMIGVLSRLVNR